jgi:hypothetical protein
MVHWGLIQNIASYSLENPRTDKNRDVCLNELILRKGKNPGFITPWVVPDLEGLRVHSVFLNTFLQCSMQEYIHK